MVRGAVEYFREHLGVGDYLSEGERRAMTWVGKGAERLGLLGGCALKDFERLCRGLSPNGEKKLLVRDKGGRRRVCFFGQISAPKDVSLLLLLGGDQRIAGWWEESVREALVEIESVVATRVRRGGVCEDRVTGEMIAAVVTHETSRALDPQLHTHVCIMNLTFDSPEGRWKGVQPSGFYRDQALFREVCHQRLARRLREGGYELSGWRSGNFDVVGVPAELRERFSKRRKAILTRAAEIGARSQNALQGVASNTRERKQSLGIAELRVRWQSEAGEEALALVHLVKRSSSRSASRVECEPRRALTFACEHLYERRSVVREGELLREMLAYSRGGLEVADARSVLSDAIAGRELVRVGGRIGSRDSLEAEREIVRWAAANLSSCDPWRSGHDAEHASEQDAAVDTVLRSRSVVTILQGDAGTGKTTTLRKIRDAVISGGGRCFACAPTAGAADVLRHELSPEAETLQRWLVDETLRERVAGSLVIVDEAGLVSLAQMRQLCRMAMRHGNRLLLVGDSKQHHAVEAGDAFRAVQRYARVPTARLTQIRRQTHPGYRTAVAALARGNIREAFDRFTALGALHEVRSPAALVMRAIDDYVRVQSTGKSVLAISPVWSEIHAFSSALRSRLRATGLLGSEERTFSTLESRRWTRAERSCPENYVAGDVLYFHRGSAGIARQGVLTVIGREDRWLQTRLPSGELRWIDPRRASGFDVCASAEMAVSRGERLLIRANERTVGLRNGDIVTVRELHPDGTIELLDGRTIPPRFRFFTWGYATTSHAAQGKTVDHGIVLMGGDALRAADLKQCYVSHSRFRESQSIFTINVAAAVAAMSRSGERPLVSELLLNAAGAGLDVIEPAPSRTSLHIHAATS